MTTTIDLTGLSLLTRAAAFGGGDFNAVVAELGIAVSNDNNAFKQLSVEDINALLEALERKCHLQHFSFAFGEVFNFDGIPEMSAFVVSSSNLRDAAKLIDWIPPLIHNAIEIDGSQFDKKAITTLSFCYPDGSEAEMPVFAEMIAAVVKRFSQLIAPHVSSLTQVSFAHAPRDEISNYERYFGCKVSFNNHRNQIQFNPGVLDQPLPGNLPPVHEQAEQSIRVKLLDSTLSGGFKNQIQTLLKKELHLFGEGIEGVSQALHIHPRKLQRELKAEGHRFSEVLAQTRKAVACDMLKHSDLDVDSIGFKLGFEERRSFTAAFKKWLGETPTAYRQSHRTRPSQDS